MGVKGTNNNKTNKSNNNNNKGNKKPKRQKESNFGAPEKVYNVLSTPGAGGSASRQYRQALLEPFSDAAVGCRLPDQYFCPTVTYAVREFLTLKVDSSGNFDVVICPSPIFCAWSSRGSIANGQQMIMKDNATYLAAMYKNAPSALANKLSAYRVVSWGVRIRQTQSINVTQGTLTCALFVPKDGLLHPAQGGADGPIGNQFSSGVSYSGNTLSNYITDAGLPKTSTGLVDIGSLVDFPYHMRSSCVNAAENTYEISPKLCSAAATAFRDTDDSVFGSDVTGQASTIYISSGDASYLKVDGWTNIIIAGSGLTASTTGAVDVEIVYNIEGNPFISSGVGVANIAVATGVKSLCDPLGSMLAQAALDTVPGFKLLGASVGRAMFNKFSGRIMNNGTQGYV